jgi:hypothetical protein
MPVPPYHTYINRNQYFSVARFRRQLPLSNRFDRFLPEYIAETSKTPFDETNILPTYRVSTRPNCLGVAEQSTLVGTTQRSRSP